MVRWLASLGLDHDGPVVAKTVRRKFINVPGRLTRRSRRAQLHLPTQWPWATEWSACFGGGVASGLRRGREELNEARAQLGLPPVQHFHGGLSRRLCMVGTF